MPSFSQRPLGQIYDIKAEYITRDEDGAFEVLTVVSIYENGRTNEIVLDRRVVDIEGHEDDTDYHIQGQLASFKELLNGLNNRDKET